VLKDLCSLPLRQKFKRYGDAERLAEANNANEFALYHTWYYLKIE